MTTREPKPRKPTKPVLAWGIKWKGKLTQYVFTKRSSALDFAYPGERIVRVEIREVVK